ncbi:MAG: glycosyltransferase [Candidatus Microsaccharimonas sp.]
MTRSPSLKIPKSKARILVIIATLGEREALLRQTLASIQRQKIDLDLVFVCPLDNESTRKLAKEFGAVRLKDPGGISAAVNVGIAAAKPWHEYISLIGDDDLLADNSLSATSSALDKNHSAVAAFGYCEYINSDGEYIITSRAGRLAPWIMKWGPDFVPLPGALFRTSALVAIGGFDPSLKYAMDLDVFLRLQKIGKLVNVGMVVSSFRWHQNSATVSNRKASSDESERVKRNHLSSIPRALSFIWERPIRIASSFAAKRITALANKK